MHHTNQIDKSIKIHETQASAPVIVLHGGPGAPGGSATLLAQELSKNFTVFEPKQRSSGGDPLSVVTHVDDLHQLINSQCGGEQPALVGESWGAMLGLAYAAKYPESVGPIVLVGCGTFDEVARAQLAKTRELRIIDYIKKHPKHSADLQLSPKDQVMKWHEMTDNYNFIADNIKNSIPENFDIKAHTQTWDDIIRCQKEKIYPQTFSSIKSPVIMLHGSYDPHPGKMIRDSLRHYIRQLEYREFEKCGHTPTIEEFAKNEFFEVLRDWLQAKLKKKN